MPRDIDHIIAEIRLRVPDVIVRQLQVKFPADDDGIWYFRLPDDAKGIQLESSYGACPFLVEHSDSQAPAVEADWAKTNFNAIERVVAYLDQRRSALTDL